MKNIKQRRLAELRLISHPGLYVGQCVPFYFCPRSVMLYILHMDNLPELSYHGGQEPIVHLEADLRKTVAWAEKHGRRWAFTLSNAGATYFEDRCDLARLGEIDWSAVQATDWRRRKEGKQAEFLVEHQFPWKLISRIGVHSHPVYRRAKGALEAATHKPPVAIKRNWYY